MDQYRLCLPSISQVFAKLRGEKHLASPLQCHPFELSFFTCQEALIGDEPEQLVKPFIFCRSMDNEAIDDALQSNDFLPKIATTIRVIQAEIEGVEVHEEDFSVEPAEQLLDI